MHKSCKGDLQIAPTIQYPVLTYRLVAILKTITFKGFNADVIEDTNRSHTPLSVIPYKVTTIAYGLTIQRSLYIPIYTT